MAAEASALLQAAFPPTGLRTNPVNYLLLVRLSLIPAQLALQADSPAAAPWLRRARA